MAESSNVMNFADQWFDTQRKVINMWQEQIYPQNNYDSAKKEESTKKDSSNPDFGNFYEEGFKSFKTFYENGYKEFSDLYTNNYSEVQKTTQEIFSKMYSGSEVYKNLNNFWLDLNSNITGKNSELLSFQTKWAEKYSRFIWENFINYLPEQARPYLNEPMKVFNLYNDYSKKFFGPWEEQYPNLQNLLTKGMSGDTSAYIDYLKLWNEQFNETFGRILSIPEFSLNKDLIKKQMQYMTAYINFLVVINEFYAVIGNQNKDIFNNIVEEYQDMLQNGTNPKSFKEFYDYWIKRNEEAFKKLFSTEEYSKLQSHVLDASVNFKKEFDTMIEKQLEFLPYPTKSDMDGVYRTIDSLKRQVRDLNKEITALKSAASKADTTAKANTTVKTDNITKK